MKLLRASFAAFCLLAALPSTAFADFDARMAEGQALIAKRELKEALGAFEAALAERPGDERPLTYLVLVGNVVGEQGRVAAAIDGLPTGLDEMGRFHRLSAQVQAFRYAGREPDVARARLQLLELWRTTSSSTIKSRDRFVRDVTTLRGTGRIVATEFFELKPPRSIRYHFSFTDTAGQSVDWISMGSYDATTNVIREMEKRPADWRMWHLDYYAQEGRVHSTLGMYPEGEPSFQTVLDLAVAHFRKIKPVQLQ
jgi:hypothetical protein